ncbi:MAG: amidohydrolase family protein [Lentisphaeria bacterium]|jgi:imidazolonepropionase-like amidohydrolase
MSQLLRIDADAHFDGQQLHPRPAAILVADGHYQAILDNFQGDADPRLPAPFREPGVNRRRERFLMPALAEAHAHLFLDGDELDAARRAAHLKAPRDQLLETGRRNLHRYRDRGIHLIRDAGDTHGINLQLRAAARAAGITLLAAGHGIRRKGRYGGFFAREADPAATADPATLVRDLAAAGADTIKIVLTGIIDFENGTVKGEPQFSVAETRAIVAAAQDCGLRTFAHCSGREGLEVAVAAGVAGIEHGFFMTGEILEQMAAGGIAWTPTFLPVHFQWAQPQHCGWSPTAVARLREILDNHERMLRRAHELGVPILAGSDAGSYGVPHADGLLTELGLMRQAGLPLAAVLHAATVAPRAQFGLPSPAIRPGNVADFITADATPALAGLTPAAAA